SSAQRRPSECRTNMRYFAVWHGKVPNKYSVTRHAPATRSGASVGGMDLIRKPFLPSDRRDTGRTLVRAACALLLSKHKGQPIKDIIAKNWSSNDRDLITRAATLPANSTTGG